MITLTREEAQQVLDSLTWCYDVTEWPANGNTPQDKAIETLSARLAQPEPEPVAWLHSFTGYGWQVVPEKLYPTDQPLYTTPPQAEPEPVAWADKRDIEREGHDFYVNRQQPAKDGVPLYTQRKEWQGLTDAEWETTHWSPDFRAGAKWAEAKLKEKNT